MLFINEEHFGEEYGPFAINFMIYLFPLINGFYQLEHDTAMENVKSKPDELIVEYVMVVLSLMSMKKFSDFFKEFLSPAHQNALDFEIFDDKSQRLEQYINNVSEELHEALDEDYFGMGLQGGKEAEGQKEPLKRLNTQSDLILNKFYSQYDNKDASIGRV